MIAPIRDLRNITSNTLTICESTLNMTANNDMDMGVDSFDQLFQDASDFFDKVRGCSLAQSAYSPRTLFISSSECEESYIKHLEKQNNKMNEDDSVVTSNSEPSNGSQLGLEYETPKSQTSYVGKAANSTNVACQQSALNKDLALNQPAGCNVFNVQLNYNYNKALDPES